LCARAPPDFAELPAGVGVPLLPIRQPLRLPATGRRRRRRRTCPRAAELLAAQFDTVAAAAGECDAPVPTGVMPTGAWR
jgi:vancomycin aglycone glucosyltransferase